jgi:hypothetical protein
MHKMTLVSLCDTRDTLIICFTLRTFVTQHIKTPKSTVHFLVRHEYRFFFVCFKEVTLYDPTIIKFVGPKKYNTFSVIYFISTLRPSCDYISVPKIIFIPNLAQYMVISKYIRIWNRNFMFVSCRVVSSILTVSYQKNTEE